MTSSRTDIRPDSETGADADTRNADTRNADTRNPDTREAHTEDTHTVGVLGPLQVVIAGREITVSGSLLRQLLLRLAVDAPRPVSAAALTEAVWGLDPPDDPVNALQSLVSRLRRVLGATTGNGGSAVTGGPAGYQLRLPGLVVDADRFTALADLGRNQLRAGEAHLAAATLRTALELWRGDALADAWEADWARPTRRSLAARRDDALLDRIDADAARGLHASLAGELAALDVEHPLDERFAGRHVDALAADGRSAAALAAYEQFRGRLADALGSDPSPALQARHLALLRAATAPAPDPVAPQAPVRAVGAGVLPLPITTFVGRAADLTAVRELLTAGRLVTVVGAGGCGKTRLATEVARNSDPDHRREVRFVQLAPVTAGNEVAAVVLSALGMSENRGADRAGTRRPLDPTQRILAAVGDAELLLLLDNCEHLLAAVAELAECLLSTCPGVRILTTSREPLALTGEALWPLAPLGVPPAARSTGPAGDHGADTGPAGVAVAYDAVRLFGDRARAARPAFVLDDTTVGDVTEIVRRLDGLPLAIELAAARLRTLPLAQITDGLSDRFRLLTGGSRTALPRHRTLRAVVEWSWELLTDAERRVAEAVSVFPAGVTAASAHAACLAVRGGDGMDGGEPAGEEGVVADILASLVDKSLLTLDGTLPRYRMLETLREFGIERLAARGELGAAYDAHARFFAELATRAEPELRTAGQLPWIRTLVAERENLAAAVRQLAADGDAAAAVSMTVRLTWFWLMADWHTDAAAAVSAALDAADRPETDALQGARRPLPDPIELVCLRGLGVINAAALDLPGAPADQAAVHRELSAVATALEVAAPDPRILPDWPRCLAVIAAPVLDAFALRTGRAGRFDVVLADPVPWVAAIGHVMVAAFAENDGDLPTLRTHAELALAALRPIGERWGLYVALRLVAQVRIFDGDLEGAAAAFREALAHSAELSTEFGMTSEDVFIRLELARVLQRLGDIDGALEQARLASAGSAAALPDMRAIASDALLLRILEAAGLHDEGRELRARMAVRLAERPRRAGPFAGHETALALSVAASLDVDDGLLDEAAAQLVEAVEAAVGTVDQPVMAAVALTVARLAKALDSDELAARLIGAAAFLRGAPDETDPDIAAQLAALRRTLGAAEVEGLTAFGGDRDAAVELLRTAAEDLRTAVRETPGQARRR